MQFLRVFGLVSVIFAISSGFSALASESGKNTELSSEKKASTETTKTEETRAEKNSSKTPVESTQIESSQEVLRK